MLNNLNNLWRGRHLRNLKFGLSSFDQSKYLLFEVCVLSYHFHLGVLAYQHMKAGFLLKISPISPLVAGLLREVLFELFDRIVLLKKVLDLGGECLGCQLALLKPQVPLVPILSF